jgi:hypothetical protein
MGRGPVWGIMIRLAGGAGTAGAGALDATAGSALRTASAAVAGPAAIGCSAVTAGAGVDSAVAIGVCGARDGVTALVDVVGTAGFASCGVLFDGTATTEEAPISPDAGGFTITGPEGAREAMAGVGAGVAEIICGACRGKGTILRGAGFDPAAAAETVPTGAALAEVPVEPGLLTACPAAEELAA